MHQSHRNDLLKGPIRGISRTSLWSAWKTIRKELRNSSIRDVNDFLDYDINPDKWINRLLARIASGAYEPETPRRFTLGKSKGFSRTMTFPSVPDLVLYRTIVDYIFLHSGGGRRHKHVYFLRDELSKAQKEALEQGRSFIKQAEDFEVIEGQYRFTGRKSFYNWLRFDQYRKHLILEEVHDFLVITDVANFFDTVLHSHVAEAVRSLPAPPRMLGLLFFLLEHLSIRQDYASSHGISLPTDQFDCSRTLAHLVLFSHDDAMVQLVGENRYVRWMDDQNIAVTTKAEGLRVLQEVGRSLGRLHLTANSKKSNILSLHEARRHYHLDLNAKLDDIESNAKDPKLSARERSHIRNQLKAFWRIAKIHEEIGEFGKILKRLYRLAGLVGLRMLRTRSAQDILDDPPLAERIANYYRCTGSVNEYLDFVEGLMSNPEQIYPDINIVLAESLLRIEAEKEDLLRIRRLTKSLIRRMNNIPGAVDCAAISTLLALRFGDARIRTLLKRCINEDKDSEPKSLIRAAAFVYASESLEKFQEVRKVAARTLRNHFSSLILLIEEIQKYDEIPGRLIARLKLRPDSVAGIQFIDMRVFLTARLLLLNTTHSVRNGILAWRDTMLRSKISDYDKRLLRRLVRV
jgi:hypothetical protein